jgi:hypothetical protein
MVLPMGHAGSVRTQVSKAGLHCAAVLALLCLPGTLIAQSTGPAEHSRSLERSGQLLFEQGVLLCQREALADKRVRLFLIPEAAETPLQARWANRRRRC